MQRCFSGELSAEMTRFEWQELEVLSRKLADADDRLAAARSTQNHGLVRLLENEIAAAKVLRDRVVLEMAARLASSPNSPPRREAAGVATNASMPAPQAEAIDGVDLVWNLLRRT